MTSISTASWKVKMKEQLRSIHENIIKEEKKKKRYFFAKQNIQTLQLYLVKVDIQYNTSTNEQRTNKNKYCGINRVKFQK